MEQLHEVDNLALLVSEPLNHDEAVNVSQVRFADDMHNFSMVVNLPAASAKLQQVHRGLDVKGAKLGLLQNADKRPALACFIQRVRHN